MKSTPDNTLPPAVSTSHTEVRLKRKILLFVTDFNAGRLLMQEIKKDGEHLVETVDDLNQVVHDIARTTPHLFVIYTPDLATEESLSYSSKVQSYFPDLPVCLIHGDLSKNLWQPGLHEVLAKPIKPESPRPYADDARLVLHDQSLNAFWKGKLNRPQREEGWEKVCSQQEARFVLQLQTGRKNHQAAKNYYRCLLAQQSGLDQEVAYRLVHGSYKALSWSRDLAVKWLALLAHYLPDTELEHLPRAGTPSPTVDFVHHDTTMEGIYVETLLILGEIKPTVRDAIMQLVSARFDGQDDDALFALSLHLYGMAKFLQQVGAAQVELMDAWLDPAIVNRANDADIPRGEHRNAGIYRDFYDLGFVINSPEPLASLLKGFHAGTTYVQQERFLPSFMEFRRFFRGEAERPVDHQTKI